MTQLRRSARTLIIIVVLFLRDMLTVWRQEVALAYYHCNTRNVFFQTVCASHLLEHLFRDRILQICRQ